jgi:hypothetical protein
MIMTNILLEPRIIVYSIANLQSSTYDIQFFTSDPLEHEIIFQAAG